MNRLRCPECESTNVEVCQDADEYEQAELECDDCGHIEIIRRLPADEYFRDEQ